MEPKKKYLAESVVLFIPIFLAMVWMGYLVVNVQDPDANISMAPSNLDTLVNTLFGFILVYAVVLLIVFIKMNKKYKEELVVKTKKKAKKKKSKKK